MSTANLSITGSYALPYLPHVDVDANGLTSEQLRSRAGAYYRYADSLGEAAKWLDELTADAETAPNYTRVDHTATVEQGGSTVRLRVTARRGEDD
jgi:hypothetical protein